MKTPDEVFEEWIATQNHPYDVRDIFKAGYEAGISKYNQVASAYSILKVENILLKRSFLQKLKDKFRCLTS